MGRWHTIKLATLSFFEYLQIKRLPVPPLPEVGSLVKLFEWTLPQFARVSEEARPLVAHFHEYLLRGGFPQCALMPSVDLAQKLLRDDIVDKVLNRRRLDEGEEELISDSLLWRRRWRALASAVSEPARCATVKPDRPPMLR